MLIKHGLTAICFMAGLALLAPGALADHHQGSDSMSHGKGGMMGSMMSGGMMAQGRMMDQDRGGRSDKMMRRHMRSEKRTERRRHHRRGWRGDRVRPISHLTVEDVRHHFEHRIKRRGNDRLKIGEVKKIDDDTITADIVTVDDSLVRRLRVDRHSGRISRE